MSIGNKLLRGVLITGLFAAAHPALADCKCADGTVFQVNGNCRDGSICRIIAPEIKRFGSEDVAPVSQAKPKQAAPVQPTAAPAQNAPAARAKMASLCGKLHSQSEFLYRCNDGTIQETNDCADGNMGHLFKPESITCKKHDTNRPNRIALSEFIGTWSTWVPGVAYTTEDRVNNERVNHVAPGSTPVRNLVIKRDGSYVWKNIRGTWSETDDDANPIVLHNALHGHDWQVSILENWYGYLAVSDAANPGDYYYGQR